MSNIPKKIIIHHSLTKDSGTVSWEAIRKYHKRKGWKDIGYHWGIERVGSEYKILKGREENESAAHTKGHNSASIGICLVGNFDIQEPPKEQLYKLIELINDIYKRYGKLPIYTHNHFASYKSCPGTKFPMEWLLNNFKYYDNSFNQSVHKLVSKGIINSPEYWINSDSYELDYFKLLINNFAKKGDFRKNIEWMHEKGVINSKDYWLLNNTYSMENCKLMIEKISKFV